MEPTEFMRLSAEMLSNANIKKCNIVNRIIMHTCPHI